MVVSCKDCDRKVDSKVIGVYAYHDAAYTYDAIGNRLSFNSQNYTYNASNEMTSSPKGSYTYDANGNTASKTSGTSVTNYAWDFEDRLASVALPNGGGTVTFKYDPFGRRIEKISPSGTTIYGYDADNVVDELNASGASTARYAQGLGIDEPLAELRSGATSFYQADGIGSITSLSDSTGALPNTYVYDTFGNVYYHPNGSVTNSYQFTAREFDSETGLYYYRARYYDPTAGRFLSEDPLRFQAGANFYPYALNGPTNLGDPTGLDVLRCERPAHIPFAKSPHTFLYSTRSSSGYGFTCGARYWLAAAEGGAVPGMLEPDSPFRTGSAGAYKPGYSCSVVSKSDCVENCVRDHFKPPYPNYQMGKYQCNDWADDVISTCKKACKECK